jgi:peptide subunit release factor 1 (eRF1)
MQKHIMNRLKTIEFLDSLAASSGETVTIYLPPLLSAPEAESIFKILPAGDDIKKHLTDIAVAAKTGTVVFWGNENKAAVVPPFPITEKYITQSLDAEKLRLMIMRDYVIALVLVRLGSYAVGVASGEKLITSKVGTGLVHGRHRQGGSSSHRFERHRDKQIETFLNRVDGHVKEQVGPYVKSLDYIVYGGARDTIQLMKKYCPLLMKLKTPVLSPLLDIADPRLPVLESAVGRVWSSTVVMF